MATGQTPAPENEQDSTPEWARQLAQRRREHHAAPAPPQKGADEWVPEAITALEQLFDQAIAQANLAFEVAALQDSLSRDGTVIVATGPTGARQISYFVSLRSVHGHGSGGAVISTSVTSAVIYIVPRVSAGTPHWFVLPTGAAFDLAAVQDLFLAVFGDDPAATSRISPWFTISGS